MKEERESSFEWKSAQAGLPMSYEDLIHGWRAWRGRMEKDIMEAQTWLKQGEVCWS